MAESQICGNDMTLLTFTLVIWNFWNILVDYTCGWYILWQTLFIFWQEIFCHSSFRSTVWNNLSSKALAVCLWFWIHLTEKKPQLIIFILSHRSFEIMCDSNTFGFQTGAVTIRLQDSIKWCHVTISEELAICICRISCM